MRKFTATFNGYEHATGRAIRGTQSSRHQWEAWRDATAIAAASLRPGATIALRTGRRVLVNAILRVSDRGHWWARQ